MLTPIDVSIASGRPCEVERLLDGRADALDDLVDDAPVGGSTASRMPNSSPPRRATVSRVAQRRLQPRAELLQQQVAAVVPERVVDLLEAVEVHEQHRDLAALVVRVVSAYWMRSPKSARFGSSVSGSWSAWYSFSSACSSSSSACLRSRLLAPATIRKQDRPDQPDPGEQQQVERARLVADLARDRARTGGRS